MICRRLLTAFFLLVATISVGVAQEPSPAADGIPNSAVRPGSDDSKLRNFKSPGRLPNRYIVIFKSEPDLAAAMSVDRASERSVLGDLAPRNLEDVQTLADAYTRQYGGRILHTYANGLRGFAIEIRNETAIKLIAEDPRVEYVMADLETRVNSVQTDGDTITRLSTRAPPHLSRVDERY